MEVTPRPLFDGQTAEGFNTNDKLFGTFFVLQSLRLNLQFSPVNNLVEHVLFFYAFVAHSLFFYFQSVYNVQNTSKKTQIIKTEISFSKQKVGSRGDPPRGIFAYFQTVLFLISPKQIVGSEMWIFVKKKINKMKVLISIFFPSLNVNRS